MNKIIISVRNKNLLFTILLFSYERLIFAMVDIIINLVTQSYGFFEKHSMFL